MRCFDYPFDPAFILQKRALRRELLASGGLGAQKRWPFSAAPRWARSKISWSCSCSSAGIRPEFYVGGYALFYEELTFDADGALAAFAPDIIYVHTSARNLGNLPLQTDTPEQAEENSPRNAPAGRACGRRRPASAARSSRTILSCPACA